MRTERVSGFFVTSIGVALISAAVAAQSSSRHAPLPAVGSVFLSPFTLTVGSETVTAEEGLLFVPENRAVRGSRLIGVHFIRLPGRVRGLAPIFFLPGGPGGFVTRENIGQARFRAELDLLRPSGRDIVFLNQRGNPATPLTPDLNVSVAARPLDVPGSRAAERVALRQAVDAAQQQWRARGVDLSGYDIVNIVDDLNDARVALGYDRIILRGGSFGSQWSFAYLKRYPQFVDRALLRGVEPLDYGYDSPAWMWKAVQRLASRAASDPRLAPLVPPEGLIGALQQVLDRLEKYPETVTITDPRRGMPVAVTIGRYDLQQQVLYPAPEASNQARLAKWPRFVLELHRGDYRFLAAQAWALRTLEDFGGIMPLLVDNSIGISADREARLLAEPEQRWLGPLEPAYFDTRDVTVTRRVSDEFLKDFRIDVPVVLLQGDLDFSTPVENAEQVVTLMPKGHLVVVEGGSHAVDAETVAMLPDVTRLLQQFLAADLSKVGRDELYRGWPARVRLPAPAYQTLEGPSLYDSWLNAMRGGR